MHIYFILFFITLAIQLLPAKSKREFNLKIVLSLLPFFLYVALRYSCFDYIAYETLYHDIQKDGVTYDPASHHEYGWYVLNKIVPSYRFLVVFQSFIVFFSYYLVIKRHITYKELAFFILLLFCIGDKSVFFMAQGMRNAISISILIISIPLIQERKIWQYLLLALLAISFHTTAVIIFPLCYVVGRNSDMSKKELSVWIFVLLFLFITPVDTIIDTIAPHFLGVGAFNKYSTYFEEESISGTMTKMVGLVLATFILYHVGIEKCTKKDNSILRLALLYIYFLYLGVLNGRAGQYFFVFLILSVMSTLRNSNNKVMKYGYFFFVFFYFCLSLKKHSESSYSGFVYFLSYL